MDNPIWSSDIFYAGELLVIMIVTAALTFGCFYISNRSDRRRLQRTVTPLATTPRATTATSDIPNDIS